MEIINLKIKKMKLLIKEQQKSYENEKIAMFVKKSLKVNIVKIKFIINLGVIVIIQVNIEVLYIAHVI